MAADNTHSTGATPEAMNETSLTEKPEVYFVEGVFDDHDNPHEAALVDDHPHKLSLSVWLSVFFLGLAFLPAVGFTQLGASAIIVNISLDLQGNTDNMTWIVNSWAITISASYAIGGYLSDIYGRRRIILVGQTLSIIGQIVCASAFSINQVFGGSSISGFGAGLIFVGYAGINEILPNKYRSLGLAWTEACIGPMNLLAPIISRSLLASGAAGISWRWLYIIGVILGSFCLLGIAFVYFPPRHPTMYHEDTVMRFRDLDFLGFFLYCGGLSVFLIGLTWGGVIYPWSSAATIAPLTLGLLSLVLCFVWDFSGIPKRPIFPWVLFRKFREFTSLCIIIAMAGFVFFSTLALLPQQFQFVYGAEGMEVGVYQLAQGFGTVFGSVVLAAFIHKIKHITWQIVAGLVVQTIFLGLYALETPRTLAMAIAFSFFANISFGYLTILATLATGLNVPQRYLGLAYGIIGQFRCAGGAMGTAIISTIVNGKVGTTMPTYLIDAVAPLGLPNPQSAVPLFIAAFTSGDLALTAAIPGISPEIVAAAQSAFQYGYAYAFRIAYLAIIPFGVVATVCGCFVLDPSKYLTRHVAVRLQHEAIGSSNSKQAQSG